MGNTYGLDWLPNGRKFLASVDRYLRLYSLDGRAEIGFRSGWSWGHVSVSRDGSLIVAASADDSWNLLTFTPQGIGQTRLFTRVLRTHFNSEPAAEFLGDSRHVVSAGGGSTVILWDTETGEPVWVALLVANGPDIVFSATGEIISGEPEVIEREIVYVVEEPDGRTQLFKPSEFKKLRASLGETARAAE
jgi:WD40 repeat protein